MMVCQAKMPSCVYAGTGSIEKITEILRKENAGSVLVFTDRGIEAAGLLPLLTDELDKGGISYTIFDDLKAEPAYTDVERVAEEAEKADGDFVIAMGGGSVMDAAKLVSLLKGASYTVRDLLADPGIAQKHLRSAMIPTTCGTGAEATCNAIVAIPEEETKKGIVSDAMIPEYVILDPAAIAGLPKAIVAATGVDALAHVVECYTSKKATMLSDTFALAGAKLIFGSIRRAYQNPEDLEAKSSMMLGAYYGGVAITASGTTAVHALSYPLGGKYHIPHGVSNAILFAHVMEYNLEACKEQLAGICDAIAPRLFGEDTYTKARYVIDQIADIVKTTDIPTDLGAYGVKMDDLDFLVEAGSQQKRLLVNNRRELSKDDIREIYLKILK